MPNLHYELPGHFVIEVLKPYGDVMEWHYQKINTNGWEHNSNLRIHKMVLRNHIPRWIWVKGLKTRVVYAGQPIRDPDSDDDGTPWGSEFYNTHEDCMKALFEEEYRKSYGIRCPAGMIPAQASAESVWMMNSTSNKCD